MAVKIYLLDSSSYFSTPPCGNDDIESLLAPYLSHVHCENDDPSIFIVTVCNNSTGKPVVESVSAAIKTLELS